MSVCVLVSACVSVTNKQKTNSAARFPIYANLNTPSQFFNRNMQMSNFRESTTCLQFAFRELEDCQQIESMTSLPQPPRDLHGEGGGGANSRRIDEQRGKLDKMADEGNGMAEENRWGYRRLAQLDIYRSCRQTDREWRQLDRVKSDSIELMPYMN